MAPSPQLAGPTEELPGPTLTPPCAQEAAAAGGSPTFSPQWAGPQVSSPVEPQPASPFAWPEPLPASPQMSCGEQGGLLSGIPQQPPASPTFGPQFDPATLSPQVGAQYPWPEPLQMSPVAGRDLFELFGSDTYSPSQSVMSQQSLIYPQPMLDGQMMWTDPTCGMAQPGGWGSVTSWRPTPGMGIGIVLVAGVFIYLLGVEFLELVFTFLVLGLLGYVVYVSVRTANKQGTMAQALPQLPPLPVGSPYSTLAASHAGDGDLPPSDLRLQSNEEKPKCPMMILDKDVYCGVDVYRGMYNGNFVAQTYREFILKPDPCNKSCFSIAAAIRKEQGHSMHPVLHVVAATGQLLFVLQRGFFSKEIRIFTTYGHFYSAVPFSAMNMPTLPPPPGVMRLIFRCRPAFPQPRYTAVTTTLANTASMFAPRRKPSEKLLNSSYGVDDWAVFSEETRIVVMRRKGPHVSWTPCSELRTCSVEQVFALISAIMELWFLK